MSSYYGDASLYNSGGENSGLTLLGLEITSIIVFLFVIGCIWWVLRKFETLRNALIGSIGGFKDKEKKTLDKESRTYRFANFIGLIPAPPKVIKQEVGAVEDQKAVEDATKIKSAVTKANSYSRRLKELNGKETNCSHYNANGQVDFTAVSRKNDLSASNCDSVKQYILDNTSKDIFRAAFQLFVDNHAT